LASRNLPPSIEDEDVSDRKLGRRARRRTEDASPPRTADEGSEIELDRLTRHLGYLARRLQRWIFKDFIQTLAPFDLRPAQYSVMTVIHANPGLTQMAIARVLGIERARLVHLIDSLEARDYVERVSSPTDRRSHAIHLTRHGEIAFAKIRALAAEHEQHVVDRVGPETHKALLRLLADFANG
jgi:DNA-binding MarR family transcriptional regulator